MGNLPKPSKRKQTHGPEEKVKMTRLRITIAKRLKEAQENAAMLTTFNEVDMGSIIEMRKDYQDDFTKKYSVKLGFMSFFVKASVVALKNFPAVNAEIEGDEDGFAEEYPLEDVEISTNDFMGKVCFSTARISVDWLFRHGSLILISGAHGNLLTEMEKY